MRKKQTGIKLIKNPFLQKFIYGIFIFLGLGGIIIPILLAFYVEFFMWDSQMEARTYKIAFEKDGKLYETPEIHSSYLAFDDHGGSDAMLYLNSFGNLGFFIALSRDEIKVSETENPFFAGKVFSPNTHKYAKSEKVYKSPTESVTVYNFFDQDQKLLLTFNPHEPNEYVQKLRPTFPMLSKQKYRIREKENYLNVTKFLREKLNRKMTIRTDKEKKLLIFSLQNAT